MLNTFILAAIILMLSDEMSSEMINDCMRYCKCSENRSLISCTGFESFDQLNFNDIKWHVDTLILEPTETIRDIDIDLDLLSKAEITFRNLAGRLRCSVDSARNDNTISSTSQSVSEDTSSGSTSQSYVDTVSVDTTSYSTLNDSSTLIDEENSTISTESTEDWLNVTNSTEYSNETIADMTTNKPETTDPSSSSSETTSQTDSSCTQSIKSRYGPDFYIIIFGILAVCICSVILNMILYSKYRRVKSIKSEISYEISYFHKGVMPNDE